MAQQRFSTSGKVSPEKLMSSPVFESIQSSNLPLEAPSEILYANAFSGEEPVEMPADLKEIFNDPNITLTAPNFRAQLEQLINQYDSDAGPWYIDGSDGILLVHNKKVTDQTETLYRYQDETGEVLKVQVTTNYVSAGVGQSMVSLGATSKGLYGTTNIAPTLEDTLDKYGSETTDPKAGLNLVLQRPPGKARFATSTTTHRGIQKPLVRTMDGTSQKTLYHNEIKANADAVRANSKNELFLQKVTDAIQQLVRQNFTGVQQPLFKAQLLDYIKTGKVGSVLGLILNKEIPLADKTIARFTHRSRLHYCKTFYIKGGRHRNTPTDQIIEDIKNSIKNQASSRVGKSRDRGVAEWKIKGTWYTDAEITAMARKQSRTGYKGYPMAISQSYIQQTANSASAKYFINNATIRGARVLNYGDKIVVTVDLSGAAPVKVTVKDMINMLAQREGSPVAMLKQANALRNSNKRAKRKEVEVQMTVVGNPLLETGQTIAIQNIGKKYSGYWHIKSCIHKLDSNGFTTSLTLDRGSGSSGITVSTSVTGQAPTPSTLKGTKGTHTGTTTVVTPNKTDNWNSRDIALLENMGAAAQTGDANARKVYNEMIELMKYSRSQGTTGEPLYEIDTDEFVYNYSTEHRRPGSKFSPKVKMTPAGKRAYEAMIKARAEEAKRRTRATEQAIRNTLKPNTSLPKLTRPSKGQLNLSIIKKK